jgi:hypothetical protein
MSVDNEDTERQQHRDPDIAGEERRTLARHHLAARLGIDPRLAEYLLELRIGPRRHGSCDQLRFRRGLRA